MEINSENIFRKLLELNYIHNTNSVLGKVISLKELCYVLSSLSGTTFDKEIENYNNSVKKYKNISDLEYNSEFDKYEEIK